MAGYRKALLLFMLSLDDTGHFLLSWRKPGEHIFTWLPYGCLYIPVARGGDIPAACDVHPQAVEHAVGLQCCCHHGQSFTADHWLHVPHGSEE
jgi:hypothetical protein